MNVTVGSQWIQKSYIQSPRNFGKLLGISPERFLHSFIKIVAVCCGVRGRALASHIDVRAAVDCLP